MSSKQMAWSPDNAASAYLETIRLVSEAVIARSLFGSVLNDDHIVLLSCNLKEYIVICKD